MRRPIHPRIVALVVTVALATAACSSADTSATATTGADQRAPTSTAAAAPTTTDTLTTVPAAGQDERAQSVPGDYGEVSSDYDAAYAPALAAGREAVDAFLAGETEALHARFSEELKAVASEEELEVVGQEVRTERVHFESVEEDAVFDGRLANGTISGSFTAASLVGAFTLEPSPSTESTVPPIGQWEGTIVVDESLPPIAFSVTFAGAGDELTATIDVPGDGVSGGALTNVSYEPSREIGDRLAESLSVQPSNSFYRSQHAWGAWTIVLAVAMGDDGTITGLLPPSWQALPDPDPAEGATDETAFRLPFDGVWLVSAGGPNLLQNHHVAAPSQRYGYDLLVWNQGGTHADAGTNNEDYWAWEQPALAPADGTVVAVLDGLEDNPPGVLKPEPHPAGNHVVLQTGADAYLFVAHFKQDSIGVVEGDRVEAGDVLGLTGNSGNSSEPHIHIHLQDKDDFFSPTASGLPLPFTDYLANGEPVSFDSPFQGQLVQNNKHDGS